jgi:hypothetical protein
MIGRAALGRPWLFTEAAALLSGQLPTTLPPPLGGVLQLALQHLHAWVDWEQDELSAVLKMRKLIPCYLAAFATAQQLQQQLFAAQSVSDWVQAVSDPDRWGFDPSEPYPLQALRRPRLKGGGQRRGGAQQRVVLPRGWLEDQGEAFDEQWMMAAGVDGCDLACEG